MSEMTTTIEELRRCAAAINDAANRLAKQSTDSGELKATAEVEEQQLTLEAVRAVLADKSRAGFTAQIRALLLKYNADRLSDVSPADYKALMADAEVLNDDAY